MRLLLDTHIFMWASGFPGVTLAPIKAALTDPGNMLYVSAATAWEIAIKVRQGRLAFPVADFFVMVETIGADLLDMTPIHALEAGSLPPLHADPFDRMLVAQARLEGMTLVTVDRTIPQYDVTVLAEG
ncbi:MAG: hypothetical protein RLY86_890 [Pseudomonadota bacterium]